MRPSRMPSRTALLCAVSSLLLSCSGGNTASKLVEAPKFDPAGQSKCGVTKSQEKPLIVEWPDSDRGELESVAKKHMVAVRYVGCEMKVLGQCTVPGKYGYTALTRKQSRVRMQDADELYANIPVFAAKFEAKLARAGELNVAMTIVGRYEADRDSVKPEDLQGNCSGATHLISALTVGAFEFFAGADATVGAGVTVGGVGAGAKSTSQRENLNQDGDKALCEKSTSKDRDAPEGCGALLRVEVVPLGEAKRAEAACPEGKKWDGAQCLADSAGGRAAIAPRDDGGYRPPNPGQSSTPAPPRAAAPAGWARVNPGTFAMGSPAYEGGRFSGETQRSVTITHAYLLKATEVTQAEWQALMGTNPSRFASCGGSCPVEQVSWFRAAAYCNALSAQQNVERCYRDESKDYDAASAAARTTPTWPKGLACTGYRLPTEAEWEYAARAGTTGAFYTGDIAQTEAGCKADANLNTTGWYCGNAVGTTHAVKQKAPNAWGLYDMLGNVSEWAWDVKLDYASGSQRDPVGPETGMYRAGRGGSWSDDARLARAAYRGGYLPESGYDYMGFRPARSIP